MTICVHLLQASDGQTGRWTAPSTLKLCSSIAECNNETCFYIHVHNYRTTRMHSADYAVEGCLSVHFITIG